MQKILLSLLFLATGLITGFFVGRNSAPEVVPPPQPHSATASPGKARSPSVPSNIVIFEDSEELTPAAPDMTIAKALAIQDEDDRDTALEEIGLRDALHNPDTARAALDSLSKIQDKETYLAGFIEALADKNAEQCFAFLATLPPGMLRESGFEHALELVAEKDPQFAAVKAAETLEGVSAFNALLSISDIWAQSNPQAALAWASAQQANQFRSDTIEQIAATWGENAPAQAAQEFLNASSLTDAERNIAVRAILGSWALEKPQEAVEWVRGNAAKIASDEMLGLVYTNWASQEPAAAAAALTKENNPAILNNTAPDVAAIWGFNAPQEAAKWVLTLPADGIRNTAVRRLLEAWTKVDVVGARKWGETLPEDHHLRQSAILSLDQAEHQFGDETAPVIMNAVEPQ